MKSFPKIPVGHSMMSGNKVIFSEEDLKTGEPVIQEEEQSIEEPIVKEEEQKIEIAEEPDIIGEAIAQSQPIEQLEDFNAPTVSDGNTIENLETENKHSKYKILDLLWLVNNKILTTPKDTYPVIEDDESHICIVSYNISFGNLKITYFRIPQGAILDNVVFMKSLENLVSGCIYPSSIARIFYSDECSFTCHEQLFTNTGERWQQERPHVHVVKKSNKITINMFNKITQKMYKQEFTDWQYNAFMKVFDFVLTNGYLLSGRNIING